MIQILKNARRLLLEVGWIQGSYHDINGYCLVGAFSASSGLSTQAIACSQYLCNKLGETALSTWNDHPGRTKEQVISFLDSVIKEKEGCVTV